MSVSNEVVDITFAGNGVTTAFAIPFQIFDNAQVKVILRDEADPDSPVLTLQVLGVDYNLSGGPPATTVDMNTAPASTEKLYLIRESDLQQLIDYINDGPFPAESHETGLDRAVLMIQELNLKINRAMLLPEGEQVTLDLVLPEPGAGKIVAYNDAGTQIVLLTPDEILSKTVEDDLEILLDAKSATIVNNQAAPADVAGWTLDAGTFTTAWYLVEYNRPATSQLVANGTVFLQRVGGAWRIAPLAFDGTDIDNNLPAGVDLTVTEAGGIAQVKYTTTNLAGGTDGKLKFKRIPFKI